MAINWARLGLDIDTQKLKYVKSIHKSRHIELNVFKDTKNNLTIVTKSGDGDEKVDKEVYGEAVIMKKLDHPHIIKLYGLVLTDNFSPIIYMEALYSSLAGFLAFDQMLNDKINDKAIVDENHWKIAMGIAAGLRYLHAQLIVHCDLKPGNVLANEDYSTVKICDFGLSTDLTTKDKTAVTWDKGTLIWIAPEIAAYSLADKKIAPENPFKPDIWSLGQIILQLYINTNGEPYSALHNTPDINILQVISTGKHDNIPADKPLTCIIAACLVKDPAKRFDAEQVVGALNEVRNTGSSSIRKAN